MSLLPILFQNNYVFNNVQKDFVTELPPYLCMNNVFPACAGQRSCSIWSIDASGNRAHTCELPVHVFHSGFFFFCCLATPEQHTYFHGSRLRRATTTPTRCTPWRTHARPSSMIISPRSRCRSRGLMWPGCCHHGNIKFLYLTILGHEVCCVCICVPVHVFVFMCVCWGVVYE